MAGCYTSNFDGNSSITFFLQLHISELKLKSLCSILAYQILKLTPQLLMLSNNCLIIVPSNSLQPRCFYLSCDLASQTTCSFYIRMGRKRVWYTQKLCISFYPTQNLTTCLIPKEKVFWLVKLPPH